MAKLTRDFQGCRNGEVYPTQFAAGDECPPELEAAAVEVDALARDTKAAKKAPATR